jgi:hypothetical protein
MKKIFLSLLLASLINQAQAQTAQQSWDNIKNVTAPSVSNGFQSEFGMPYKQPRW